VEICKKWLEKNKSCFVRTEFITATKNTGIAPNANRGLNKAKGEWIKFIAGDDLLLENTIEKNILFIKENPTSEIVFSNYFSLKLEDDSLTKILIDNTFFNLSNLEQIKYLITKNIPAAPTVFFKSSTIKNVNGFNEKFPMIEDYPLWVKLTCLNCKFSFLNDVTVIYRQNPTSVQKTKSASYYKFRRDLYKFKMLKLVPLAIKYKDFKSVFNITSVFFRFFMYSYIKNFINSRLMKTN